MDTAAGFAERYGAVRSRDARFDGQFVTAVHSTRIYCRPSCPARTPRPDGVTFYRTAAAAHEAGYRACKRCLPDAVPGSPEWNLRGDLAARAMRLVADGVVERSGVAGLAARLGYSPRHVARVLTEELGAGPLALARAHRAQTARALLTGTDLPVTDVAFAAGFASVRQFNATIAEVYALTPSQLRARRRGGATASEPAAPGVLDLTLPVRPPFDAAGVLAWLAVRAVPGVEVAADGTYARTLALPGGPAWFQVWPAPDRLRLRARLAHLADLPALVARVRRLFDLDADPAAVDAALGAVPELAASVAANPGIRLPGAVDPAEMLVRAIVGQQISVAAARTQLARLTAACGDELPEDVRAGAPDGLTRMFPAPAGILGPGEASLVGPRVKIAALLGAARALEDGLDLGVGDDLHAQHDRLVALPGVGEWTAGYVAMRVLGAPDVFLPGDVAVRTGARELSLPGEARPLAAWAERLAPWRSYLCLHLWRAAAGAERPARPGRAARSVEPSRSAPPSRPVVAATDTPEVPR